ncbi:MAG: hypothetical protein B7Z62_08825 [Deltaproteobacteria bacterium 37-65-8]|nr:MAG: hypothetical protein B7Z62_08825 [Deltaproteobacteria bacterium 37-65-8]
MSNHKPTHSQLEEYDMAKLNFNAAEVQPSEGRSFDPIPDSWQPALISESEMKPTKAGDGQYLAVTFEILDGEYKSRKVWANLNLDNPNPKAVEIAYADLSAICYAAGKLNVANSEELHGIPLEIHVKPSKPKGDFAPSTEIVGYRTSSTVAAQRVGNRTPVAAAKPAASTPPWAKK